MSLPKPYYQDRWVTIYNADCREVLPELPKVDLVLTDFPYGNDMDYGGYKDTKENLAGLVKSIMPMILLKSKRALITCGVANMWLYPEPKWTLCWATTAGVGSGPWGFCCWQPVLAYGNDPYLEAGKGRRADTIILNETSEEFGHPCTKPISLWQRLILRGSIKTDDIILDPFLGSGTTLRASINLNRKCIGIEISEEYCHIAATRCSQMVLDLSNTQSDISQDTSPANADRHPSLLEEN